MAAQEELSRDFKGSNHLACYSSFRVVFYIPHAHREVGSTENLSKKNLVLKPLVLLQDNTKNL